MVFGSALSPFALGWLFGRGASASLVLAGCAAYALVGGSLMRVAFRSGVSRRAGRPVW
jgi:hypothetical protein